MDFDQYLASWEPCPSGSFPNQCRADRGKGRPLNSKDAWNLLKNLAATPGRQVETGILAERVVRKKMQILHAMRTRWEGAG